MLANVCSLEKTDAIKFFPSRKYSEVIRLPHISRSRKTSFKIFICKQQTIPHFHVQKAILNLTSSLCTVLLDLYLESLLLENCLLLSLKIYSTVKMSQYSKGRAFNPVQRCSGILTSVMSVEIFPPILIALRFSSTYFIMSVAFLTCFPFCFFPLDYKKTPFFQWSCICVCVYRSIQFCIYAVAVTLCNWHFSLPPSL